MGNNLIHNYLNNPKNFTQNRSNDSKPAERSYISMPSVSSAIDSFDIETDKLVKPLDGKGHLVNGNITRMPKEFVRDTVYTTKALVDGARGKANDHQLGKLNDLGLKIGGIAIATYLMTRKATPKTKAMEFIGFGAFLASMALWPKIALEIPARIIHGFNFRKQYVDEQGRKKYVSQDPNYIPFDLYKGDKKSEDLDVIGDRAGIRRDIPNRHEAVKEHMRKVSVQNNTLWMLTAGIATPLMTALACNGAEKALTSPLEKMGNKKANQNIDMTVNYLNNTLDKEATDKFEKVKLGLNSGKESGFETLLNSMKGKILKSEDINKLSDTLADGFDAEMKDAAKADIKDLISEERYITNSSSASKLTKTIHSVISSADTELANKLTQEKLNKAVSEGIIRGAVRDMLTDVGFNVLDKDGNYKNSKLSTNFKSIVIDNINFLEVTEETKNMTPEARLAHNIKKVVQKVNNANSSEDFISGMSELEGSNKGLFDSVYRKLGSDAESIAHNFYEGTLAITEGREKFVRESVGRLFKSEAKKDIAHKKIFSAIGNVLSEDAAYNRGFILTDKAAETLSEVSKQIDKFNAVDKVLSDAAHFKVEKANETVVANNWDEVSKLFVKELKISDKEIANAGKDKAFSNKLLAEKLSEVCSNEESYTNFIKKLAGKMVELDEKLDAPNPDSSGRMMNKLEEGISKNCDNTGKILKELGMENMHLKMSGVHSNDWGIDVGSIKNAKIERMHSRVEGVHSSYMRLIQTAEFFHRAHGYEEAIKDPNCNMEAVARRFGLTSDKEINAKLIEDGKKLLLDAHTSDYYNKMGMHNNKAYFKTLLWSVFRPNKDTPNWNENWASSTLETIKKLDEVEVNGNAPRRVFDAAETKSLGQKMMEHMNHMYNSFGTIARAIRNDCEHIVTDGGVAETEKRACRRFDLLGKATNDFFHDTIKQMSNSKKWMKTFAPILGVTYLATVGAQFLFGKKDPDIKA